MQILINSELRYRRQFETAQDGILILDAETGMIKDINPYLINMLGYSREEFVKKKLWEVGAFRDIEANKSAFEALQENEYIRYDDLPLKTRDGQLIQVEFISTLHLAGDEKVIQCNIRDVTEYKQIIVALQANEKKYHDLINQSPDGYFIIEFSGNILTVNKAMCKELEFSEEELLSMNIWDIIPEAYLDQYKERLTKILRGESLKEAAEYMVRGKHGAIHFVEVLSAPRYGDGNIIGFQGIARDITARKRTEDALQESESKFRKLVTHLPTVVYMNEVGDASSTLFVSPQIETLMGYTPLEWLADPKLWSRTLHPEDHQRVLKQVAHTDQSNKPFDMEYRMIARDGRLVWVHDRVVLMNDAEGQPQFWQGIMLDITERKLAEGILYDSEERFKNAFHYSAIGMALVSLTGKWLKVNSKLCSIVGYSEEELLTKTFQDLTHPEDLNSDLNYLNQLLAGEIKSYTMEKRYFHKDGKIVWALLAVALARDNADAPLYFVSQINDITDHKQAEMEIRQRLSELEVLYQSGLALNQLITPKAIAEKIIDLLDQEMDWHHTAIRLYHPETKMLELLAFHLPYPNGQEEHFATKKRFKAIQRFDQGLSGWVVQNGQAVRSNDLKNDPRYFETFPDLQSGLYIPIRIAERVIGVISIESKQPQAFNESDERLVITVANQAAIAINNAQLFESLQSSNLDLSDAYDATIEGWSRALDLRDKETEGHTQRVTKMTVKLARAFGLSQLELVQVRWGALLHDIGKMGVPDGILFKPGDLTDEEWVAMKKHPTFAHEMLTPIHYLKLALDIPYCHHEKWDGTGYPRGLKGDRIPLTARIFAVVDVWDALKSDRPYRAPWPEEKIREHICASSGTHFDPQVVDVFMQTFN